MSLIKQLWIGILIVMSIALGGSFVVSTLSARHYLEQQLRVKNLDNATSLALSMSQMDKDDVTVELQIAAQFDAGHYRLIRLTSPTGKVIAEREYSDALVGAPEWFMRLIPIEVPPGVAQVQDGWRQFGTLTLESHARYAYEALWRGTLQLLGWFFVGAMLTGAIGTILVKHVTRPLHGVVEQAEAIGGRRFITTEEPSTTEFRSVVRAMNALSERVRNMLAEEAQRLERLRRQTQQDELTGLANRGHFLNLTGSALAREDAVAGGTLALTRLGDLLALNQQLGRQETDRLLREIADCFSKLAAAHPGWEAGRLNASDFALLAVGDLDAEGVSGALSERLQALQSQWSERVALRLPIGASAYRPGESRGALLARTDGALAAAELAGDRTIQIVTADRAPLPHANLDEWRQAILGALRAHGARLALYPARRANGELLHHEAPMRLLLDGDWQSAGYFMPHAARLGLLSQLDAAVLTEAISTIAAKNEPVGINLSADAMRDPVFIGALFSTLRSHPAQARQLWLEVPEFDVVRNLPEFRAMCAVLKPLGAKVGIEHVGPQFGRISDLHELGIDYIKTERALTQDIEASPGNQSFLRGLCTIAHSIGVTVIAEGVGTDAEMRTLAELGVDGMTGPGVK
ncbi:MAG: hypothetical protein RIS35_975 [Pseudomonadota bacterium]|jgi:EAL domain-containing protein (putative c-di-GMP-specific phosphodiesterase class I)/GGDEF domain-containing protein